MCTYLQVAIKLNTPHHTYDRRYEHVYRREL